jgi:hypothetical protein
LVTVSEACSIRSVGLTGPEALLVAQLNCLPQIICRKVVDDIVPASAKESIPRRSVKIETRNKNGAAPVLSQPLDIFLVIAHAPQPAPASQLSFSLLSDSFTIGIALANCFDPALPVSIDLLLLTCLLRRRLLWCGPTVPLILLLLLCLLLPLSLLLGSLLLSLGAAGLPLRLLCLLCLLSLLLALLPHLLSLRLLWLLSLLSLLLALLPHLLPLRLLWLLRSRLLLSRLTLCLLLSRLLPRLVLLLPLLFVGLLLGAVVLSGRRQTPSY